MLPIIGYMKCRYYKSENVVRNGYQPNEIKEIHNFKVNKEAQLSRLLLPSDVILKKNGEWKAQREYQDYKIINLIH